MDEEGQRQVRAAGAVVSDFTRLMREEGRKRKLEIEEAERKEEEETRKWAAYVDPRTLPPAERREYFIRYGNPGKQVDPHIWQVQKCIQLSAL